MAGKPKSTIADRLTAAQVAISNTLADAEIKALVEGYGYTEERMREGVALHDAAEKSVNAQTAAAGAPREVTATTESAKKDARDAYQALAQVARALFAHDPAQLATLGVTGAAPRSTAGLLTAGYALFDNALGVEAVRTALAGYGYDEARLRNERERVAAFDRANQAQEAAKGAAQQATREQDAALAALDDWVAQYLKIAKVALRGKKQLLEKLGLATRSGKTAAQRAAPKKAAATRTARKASG